MDTDKELPKFHTLFLGFIKASDDFKIYNKLRMEILKLMRFKSM